MQFLKLEDAANSLNITVVRLLEHINSGKIPAHKIGSEYFVQDSDLEQFRANQIEKRSTDEPARNMIPKGRPRGKPGARHFPIPGGLSSPFMEAIAEIGSDIELLSELKDYIAQHGRECLQLVEKIEKEGITDPQTAIDLLLYDEAIQNLGVRRDIFFRLYQGTAIVLLPLPPHLSDPFLSATTARPSKVFNTDRHLPPHLKNTHYPNVDMIQLHELNRLIEGADAIVLEGYSEHNQIYVREPAFNVLYLMSIRGLKDIFIHFIPTIPPNARFTVLEISNPEINIGSV